MIGLDRMGAPPKPPGGGSMRSDPCERDRGGEAFSLDFGRDAKSDLPTNDTGVLQGSRVPDPHTRRPGLEGRRSASPPAPKSSAETPSGPQPDLPVDGPQRVRDGQARDCGHREIQTDPGPAEDAVRAAAATTDDVSLAQPTTQLAPPHAPDGLPGHLPDQMLALLGFGPQAQLASTALAPASTAALAAGAGAVPTVPGPFSAGAMIAAVGIVQGAPEAPLGEAGNSSATVLASALAGTATAPTGIPAGAVPMPATALPPPMLAVSSAAESAAAFAGVMQAMQPASEDREDPSAPALETLDVNGPGLIGGRGPAETLTSRPVTALAPVVMPADPDAGFDDAFGSRIVWMAEQRIGHAELRISPEGAGAIDIRLQIDGNRITAQFNAANADVRQALEGGIERLKDMLGRHGMELAHSEVGGQRQPGGRAGHHDSALSGESDDADAQPQVTTLRSLRARGLVDEYV